MRTVLQEKESKLRKFEQDSSEHSDYRNNVDEELQANHSTIQNLQESLRELQEENAQQKEELEDSKVIQPLFQRSVLSWRNQRLKNDELQNQLEEQKLRERCSPECALKYTKRFGGGSGRLLISKFTLTWPHSKTNEIMSKRYDHECRRFALLLSSPIVKTSHCQSSRRNMK